MESNGAKAIINQLGYNGDMSTIRVQDLARDVLGSLRRVESGETLVITRDELPVAEIKPLTQASAEPRPYGLCAGEFTVPADFDASLPDDVLDDFEGRRGSFSTRTCSFGTSRPILRYPTHSAPPSKMPPTRSF
jgi:antitoxin (DNA-binding transcriptional repressor) of toxin-antitoxin stability system